MIEGSLLSDMKVFSVTGIKSESLEPSGGAQWWRPVNMRLETLLFYCCATVCKPGPALKNIILMFYGWWSGFFL